MIYDKIVLYEDVGYCAGGHHVCRRGSTPTAVASTQTYTFTKVKQMYNDLRAIDLPIEYLTALHCTYIEVVIGSKHYYGWIKEVTLIGMPAPNKTESSHIKWDFDYWRTWGLQAKLGSGRMTLSPSDNGNPNNVVKGFLQKSSEFNSIRNYLDDVYFTASGTISAENKNTIYRNTLWVVLLRTVSGQNQTQLQTICWPVGNHIYDYPQQNDYYGPNLKDIYDGYTDDYLNIDPDTILGAWITPACPYPSAFDIVQRGMYDYAWAPKTNLVAIQTQGASGHGFFILREGQNNSNPGITSQTIPALYLSQTKDQTTCLADFNGNIVWTIPYGLSLQSTAYIGYAFSPLSGQMSVRFKTSATSHFSEDQANGLVAVVMLPEIPVTSNTWQSYVLSGQREYDIEAAKAANEAAYKKGLTNTGSAAIEGAIGGAIAGGGIGAAAGAVIGAGLNVIASTINKGIDEDLREKTQALKDHATANQQQYMIVNGQCSYWIQAGEMPKLLLLTSYDANQTYYYQAQYGYDCDVQSSSFNTTIITTGAVGPIRIENLDVTGPIPTEARIQIRNMFAQGIYLD